ncbi:MAG: glycosyltransferase family 1 protein [Candidatus Helarchaeota archaeon]
MNRGGAETFIMNIYRNLDKTKIQFDFILHTTNQCAYDDEIRALGGKIYNVPRYKGINHIKYIKAWNDFFKGHSEYKIIHGHIRSTASIYLRIAKRYGLITIVHSHNTSSLGNIIERTVKNFIQIPLKYIADYLFACSHKAGEWLYGQKACRKNNFFIINNAIETNNFIFNKNVRISIRNHFNVPDKVVIGHIGSFTHQKNHTFLIDVFKEVHERNRNTVLLLVGDGELRSSIEKKVRDLGLKNSVIFTGVRADIPALLQAMDVFVFPSLFEGLGIVVIEAQASGLPCIVSDAIPKEAYVTDNIENLSLKESIEIWTDKILKHIHDKRENKYQEIVEKGYDIEETVQWLQEFYLTC